VRRIELPVIVIVLLATVMFGRGLLPGKVLSSSDVLYEAFPWQALPSRVDMQNGLLGDEAFQFQPWKIYAARQIRSGHFPLWNPHAFGGAPLFGNSLSAILFPFQRAGLPDTGQQSRGLEAILKIATAGLGMYWMLRVFRSSIDCGASGCDRIHVQRLSSRVAWLPANECGGLASALSGTKRAGSVRACSGSMPATWHSWLESYF